MKIDNTYTITPVTGKTGKDIKAQYSVNGSSSWHETFASGDLYMRTSTDGGTTWSSAMRVVGEKGATGKTGPDGTKTFYSDFARTWTNTNWTTYSAVGFSDSWNNSTVDGMRVGDTFVITVTLSEKGNSKGQVFTQITSVPTAKDSNGYYRITAKTVSSMIGEKGQTGAKGDTGPQGIQGIQGERGGRDLSVTTNPSSYTTKVGTFTPAYRISLSTVKTQSGIDTVYTGDTLVYGVYRYPIGYVDTSYVYTAARTSVKGDKGDKGDAGPQGIQGPQGNRGFSSRTIAYRVNYSTFSATNSGEIYVCGYNDSGAQADVAGYVIVNGTTHYIKGMLNSNVPMNGFLAVQTGGTSSAPKAPVYVIHDWYNNKFYTIANSLTITGKKWNELFTEITNTSAYIVLGKVSNLGAEGVIDFEETTPCLLSSTLDVEVNFIYQGVVATTTDMSNSITPYKFSQDTNGSWIKTALSAKTVRKWAFVLCMNAATPTASTAAPTIKYFNGTWWQEVPTGAAYYSSLQSQMAGDLPAVAGYYDTLKLSVPAICGTYIKTLTSNKAFINELFTNDIVVGNKIRSSNNNFSIDKDGKAILKNVEIDTGSESDTGIAISGGGWTDSTSTTGFGITKSGEIYGTKGRFSGGISEIRTIGETTFPASTEGGKVTFIGSIQHLERDTQYRVFITYYNSYSGLTKAVADFVYFWSSSPRAQYPESSIYGFIYDDSTTIGKQSYSPEIKIACKVGRPTMTTTFTLKAAITRL